MKIIIPRELSIIKTLRAVCAIAFILMLSGNVHAQDKQGFFDVFGRNVSDGVQYVINSVIGAGFANTVKSAALGMSSATLTLAYALGGALAIISVFWKSLIDMLQKKPILGSVLEVVVYASVATVLIANYTQFVEQIWVIAQSLLSSIAPGGMGDALVSYATSIFGALGRVWGSIMDAIIVDGWDVAVILDALGSLIVIVGVFVMMLMSISEIIGVMVMGPMFFAVGIVFGPLMIATMISDFTRSWFGQWLNFLVGSAMLTTVAVVVLMLIVQIIDAALAQIGQPGSSGLLSLMGLGVLSMSFSKLFSSVPAITDAIFPGRTGAGSAINTGGGAKAIVAAAMGVGGLKAAAATAKATPAAVSQAASAAAGATIAGLNAKTHLTKGLEAAVKSIGDAGRAIQGGASDFAYQAKHSDAGKFTRNLTESAKNSANNFADKVTGTSNPPPAPPPSWHKHAQDPNP